jgi:hypothetical protein
MHYGAVMCPSAYTRIFSENTVGNPIYNFIGIIGSNVSRKSDFVSNPPNATKSTRNSRGSNLPSQILSERAHHINMCT